MAGKWNNDNDDDAMGLELEGLNSNKTLSLRPLT